MRLTAYAENVSPATLDTVRNYILAAARFDYASWPTGNSYLCVIWKDGIPLRVGSGTNWATTSGLIYVDSNPQVNVPNWAPAALKCIAEWFGIGDEAPIAEAIEIMLEEIRFRIRDEADRATAYSRRGRPVRKIAIHAIQNTEAGYYNVANEGERDRMEWRDHSGNPVEVAEAHPDWIIMDW